MDIQKKSTCVGSSSASRRCTVYSTLPRGSASMNFGKDSRIDADQVRREVEAAGFRLAAMSDALMNMDDPRDVSVFDDAWRGRTDRFVYKFVKPR
jgi:predicted methyltransferase